MIIAIWKRIEAEKLRDERIVGIGSSCAVHTKQDGRRETYEHNLFHVYFLFFSPTFLCVSFLIFKLSLPLEMNGGPRIFPSFQANWNIKEKRSAFFDHGNCDLITTILNLEDFCQLWFESNKLYKNCRYMYTSCTLHICIITRVCIYEFVIMYTSNFM